MLAISEKQLPATTAPVGQGNPSPIIPTVPEQKLSLSLKELWRQLWRQKALFFITLFTVFGLAVLITLLSTPQYRATSTIQIEKQGAQIVDFGELNTPSPDMGEQDPFFRTQYEQLKSRELITQVINKLNLEQRLFTHNFGSDFSTAFKAQANYMMQPVKNLVLQLLPEEDANKPPRSPDWVQEFLEKLYVEPVEKTHLVNVFFDSPDADLSAEIVNELIHTFIKGSLTEKSETDNYAQAFLERELEKARERLTRSENARVQYAKDKDILEVNNSQATQEQKLNNLNAALSTAESRRIEADSQLQEAQVHRSVNGILNNPVVSGLKSQLATLEAQYQNQSQLFKPAYPGMQQLAQEISALRQQINREINTVETSLQAEQIAARHLEDKLRGELQDYKDELVTLRDNSVEYNALQREVDTNQKLYEELLARQKEISVAAGTGAVSSNVKVIDKAKAPLKPTRPNILLNLLLGLLTGSLLATGLALFRESLSDSLHSAEQLQAISGLPVLGTIPYVSSTQRRQLPLAAARAVGSSVSEAYRVAATHLKFMDNGQGMPRVVLITSTHPGEGKSTSSANLALSMAQMGHKVLLIDADLRRPSLHHKMHLDNHRGLAEYLHGDIELNQATQHFTEIRNTYVITAGRLRLDPIEAISCPRMKKLMEMARQYFDITLIDAPPVTGFADALLLAGQADVTVMVASEAQMNREQLRNAIQQLQRIKHNIAGFLVVKARKTPVPEDYYARYQRRTPADTPPLGLSPNSRTPGGGLNLAK